MQTDEEKADYITEAEEALQMLGKGYNGDPVPPNEFVSVMSGFTPAPDVLCKEYGYITALVWGRVWRYCQMADGVCRAAIGKIGAGLGMSDRTIIRHMEELCQGGYLFDTTPELRNRPHIYADTFKIRIRVSVEAGVTQSHSAMTESHTRYDRESHEESIKKPIKKLKEKEAAKPTPTTPDEVKLFREVTNRYPPKVNFEDVVASVKKVEWRLGRAVTRDDLLHFFKAWTAKGYKPINLAWLEWAESGQIPQNGTWKPQNQNFNNNLSILQAFAEKG